MIDIIKEAEVKEITNDDLKINKLFIFYNSKSYENTNIYYIISILSDKVTFKNINNLYSRILPIDEFKNSIQFLDTFAEERLKSSLDVENYETIVKQNIEAENIYNLKQAELRKLSLEQEVIRKKIVDTTKVTRYIDKIKLIRDALLVYYEPNNLSMRMISDTILEVAFLFPDITISNSRKASHNIKDLLVFAKFNLENMKLYEDISGYRGSVSVQEVISNYNHSHLSKTSIGTITKFCLGDSEMAVLIAEMKTNPLTAQKIEYFCGALDQYVRWESLEGTPYIELKNVNAANEPISNLAENVKLSYYTKFIKNKIPFKLNYEPLKQRFSVKINEEDILALIPVGDSSVKAIKRDSAYYKITTNNTELKRTASSRVSVRNTYYFDGVKAVILYEVPESTDIKYSIHPHLVDYIVKKLEEEAYKHLILKQ